VANDPFRAVGALADPVRRAVYEYVGAHDVAVGREQVAADLGIALHAARFHLERLADEGLLCTEQRRLSGRTGPGAGRPAKLYRRSEGEVSVSLPARGYDLVGSILAAAAALALRGRSLETGLRQQAESRGRAAGEAFAVTAGERPRVADVLAEQGFEPVPDEGGLVLRNCPFDALAREEPELVCGINRDFVEGIIGGLGCTATRAVLDPAPGRCCVRVQTAS
jgi:predicted ArsR family transcriptional regulator